jgi:uncharacterized alkaline shock family protein YloU
VTVPTAELARDPDAATPAARRHPRTGSLSIADRVITKIASQAAAEVDHVVSPVSSGFWRAGNGIPKATAVIEGRWVQLGVDIVVEYPTSLRAVTKAVRTRVIDRVTGLSGLEVKEVDVRIVALPVAPAEHRRVL